MPQGLRNWNRAGFSDGRLDGIGRGFAQEPGNAEHERERAVEKQNIPPTAQPRRQDGRADHRTEHESERHAH